MSIQELASASGLDTTEVAVTLLSHVDGEAGHLAIAGYDVEELAPKISFAALLALLWRGSLPDVEEEKVWAQNLGAARVAAFEQLAKPAQAIASTPGTFARDGMAALRAVIARFDSGTGAGDSDGGFVREATALTAAVAVQAAIWNRARCGEDLLPPDPAAGHAADFLRMATGRTPSAAAARALNTYLITVSDHGMNASTFATRVVASTGSDLVSAVTAGIGALKGPLHGGAPGPVLDMLDAIGLPVNAAAWIEAELIAGRRIMGMGHRIYRVRDPRAAVLELATKEFELTMAGSRRNVRLAMARAVEQAATGILAARHPNRPLKANVEFYTAVILDAIGLPKELFSPVFALARVVGWCAHFAEQNRVGRLIRPQSRYAGEFGKKVAG